VFSTTHTEQHVADIAELIAPQGRFGLIDDPKAFDIMVFKRKAVSIHHELMFTRSIYGTPDMNEQGEILDAMAVLVDDGKIRTTLTGDLSPINAANLKTVHALIESGAAKRQDRPRRLLTTAIAKHLVQPQERRTGYAPAMRIP
jgi:NADPH2:quinone reductase